ncbi:hypothetical protein T07_9621 [Trichinella nelsoni]|uniref:Uncharacterized protein n=2 Tax=Trichinella TaxID=6333 RepID=A0A0V0SLA2_9BILA|nr:hypothetical protein T07_9621 [Trichinella nelsoni]KRX49550.1 hypothetical protein T05_7837 [Trichinella murrelli]KRX60778.1 hypothetical protein T09_9378 [Trichinella sp. T9]
MRAWTPDFNDADLDRLRRQSCEMNKPQTSCRRALNHSSGENGSQQRDRGKNCQEMLQRSEK